MSLPAASREHTVVVTGRDRLARELSDVRVDVEPCDLADVSRTCHTSRSSSEDAFYSRFMPNAILLPIAKRLTEERLAR